ncbi:hypothetical protein Misp01_50020 [Microtetraspora sp. NBRC 13810]|uniref:M16 family metallopeptidase n=1 Tax=Microtetraspora sp. NBRC 13810 TaxID=3030990 RepID=UPI00249FFEB2|nr:M16 family metallopeptidase [Microtetraspora sp. NBRC 13810]GLW09873.1 hypothetical protein Misp01_50020 [Microtetraspora sp. NBRC 13810]
MHRISRTILPNGLRLVMSPDPCARTVGISLHYGVGFRSEPVGRTGFAHLFEHLMFEGSPNVGPGEHGRLIRAAGGTSNGSTGPDVTNFYQTVPSSALERALYLEADRLRAPRVTGRALAKQLAVVKEEIRRNVLSKPYGRFPWPAVSETLYQDFANTHDGYGDFQDLDRATTEDCEEFFHAYYHPGNCVLAICGDIEPAHTADLVERHFAGIPAGTGGAARDAVVEPVRTGEFHRVHEDGHAPGPALALGYRLPDPGVALGDYLAHMLLSTLLTDGVTSRLPRALAQHGLGSVTVSSGCGLVGGPLRARDPDTFTVSAFHHASVAADRIVSVIDTEVALICSPGVPHDELSGAVARTSAAWSRAHARPGERARALGRLESLFGAAELVHDLPGLLAGTTHERLAAAARHLQNGARAVVEVRPVRRPPVPSEGGKPQVGGRAEADAAEERAGEPVGLPPLGRLRAAAPADLADVTLGNGLRVVAVRSPAVPLVSLRLTVPLPAGGDAETAAAAVLGAMLLRESRCAGVAALEHVGWTVVPLADTRRLVLSGNGPAAGLGVALRTLAAAIVDTGGYGPADVRAVRSLIAQQITALTAHPAAVARAALRRRWYADGAAETAAAPAVAAVTAADVAACHAGCLTPADASLVLVGDLDPGRVIDEVGVRLAGWHGGPAAPYPPGGTPLFPAAGSWEVVDRPGAGAAQIRFAAPWVAPGHPGFPALEIANTVFGGYSSARLATTLRDRHGLTYSARSVIEPGRDHSLLVVSFDVRKEAADHAIEEFFNVVDGVTRTPFGAGEVGDARHYLIGRWLSGVGGQDDLAAALSGRLDLGLPPGEIFDYSERLARTRYEDVVSAAGRHLVSGAFAGIVVGDAARISPVRQHVST